MVTSAAPRVHDTPLIGLLPTAGVSLSAFLLFALQLAGWGHALLVVSLLGAWAVSRELVKDLALVGIGITIVSTTSVEADVSWDRFFTIGTVLLSAVGLPYLVDRFVYRREAIRFPWRTGQRWTRLEKGYLVAVPVLGWLILPYYFITSGAYLNWPNITDRSELARFFVGVNFVGTWDELFFICTCFALLRRHFGMWQANVLQAVIFVSFLWELGYREWGPFLTAPFALLQGWIFSRTGSLTYVLIVHLLFDVFVFLAIVHAHNPGALPIFLV
ncbi:CPBP family intramembrane metalloprotease [Georgenia yuyongxinii]|uniref:CPBP family intramembrane metalloprotease n=1 Tax=Georgenia yuyongxinii TaxID=2589797 RepID=A0A5B8BZR5_9MICO|nr:CPBP family intramembrane glutamic endopeptidase [Georgenia yuyongxinii]QDC23814.1 CPBP family intramembrane metalloprotease [Georgenia yuyongxinii]